MSQLLVNKVEPGQRFGMWTVVLGRERGSYSASCKCDCGVERNVVARSLVTGRSVSCGCARDALTGVRFTKHGLRGSRSYQSWAGMIARCTNPGHKDWKHYGGRGISVCDRWRESFADFFADMGERPEGLTIDRIDNDRGYEPGNCRWATATEQSRNRRRRS